MPDGLGLLILKAAETGKIPEEGLATLKETLPWVFVLACKYLKKEEELQQFI